MLLAKFLRDHRAGILLEWERHARRALSPAATLDRPALLDSLPPLLDQLVSALSSPEPENERPVDRLARAHAFDRVTQGYGVSQVVHELSLLRSLVLRMWRTADARSATANADDPEGERWSALVDRVIEESISQYVDTRTRILEAFEQIADAAFNIDDLNAFLQRLVEIFSSNAPSLDSVAILLREGDRLFVRAAIGLESELREGYSIGVGEGFAGTVASTKKPLLLTEASRDPLVKSRAIRDRGTRALYGVPLFDRDEVIGVAHVGTRESDEIPTLERRVFAALAQRATSAIIKHRLRAELRRAVEEMKRTAEFRELLIGIVSHDLRNPLNAIAMGGAILVRSRDLAPSLARPAGRILANVERMKRIVSDLLDFTCGRLGGGIPIAARPADLADLARAVIEELELSDVHVVESTVLGDPRGTWDPERLAQVLGNLLGNAFQHGDPSQPVRVVVDGRATERVSLTVRNAGEPIPADVLPHVFDPFRRAGASRDAGGLGLGLFIAHEITRAHGGTIDVVSADRETAFTVTLPRG
jgi:signal transduction histidine kinase